MATTYKIGEAAALLNLKTYVLRFWETEFPEIVPLRTEKGQRLYTQEHLALLERIRYLLHERGLTIGGARRALAEEKAQGAVYAFDASAGDTPDAPPPDFLDASAEESEDDAADDDDEQGEQDEQGERASGTGRPQYNLPGLEELVALSKAVTAGSPYAVAERPEFASGHEQGDGAAQLLTPSPGAGPPPQDVLPLFNMVRSALQKAGKVAGVPIPGRGGDNFIQAAPDAPAVPDTKGAPRAPSPDAMRLIIEELEQVARILHPDKPAAKKHGLRLIL